MILGNALLHFMSVQHARRRLWLERMLQHKQKPQSNHSLPLNASTRTPVKKNNLSANHQGNDKRNETDSLDIS